MADEDDINVKINVEAAGDAEIKSITTALSNLAASLRDVQKSVGASARDAEKLEKSYAGIGKAAQASVAQVKNLANASKEASLYAQQQRDKIFPGIPATQAARAASDKVNIEAENRALREQLTIRRQIVEAQKAGRTGLAVGAKLETGTHAGSAAEVAARMQAAGSIRALTVAEENRATALQRVNNIKRQAVEAELAHVSSLTNLRYALYDVQRSFLVTGLGLAAFSGLVIKSAMDYETAMAQISRTSGISGDALQNVRNDFVELAQTIPTAFADLSKIGTLGGQLNIPAQSLGNFTETVAKFTATTNVAVETSATAFGRLDALLPDVQGNYEALGSSILNVGINSVATETEIIATTNQIAAAGQQAGLSAQQIIGLAASYASLGVAPEAARGTTIRFFATISKAVSEGGLNLEKFAQLSGKSSEQFQKDWTENTGQAVLDLLGNMQKLGAQGENLETVIRSLGITAVRDINALLKLSQNAEVVAANFGYAADGFEDATQLGAAFEVQAATLASKLQVLVNSVQAFFAEIGEKGIGPLGFFVDVLNNLLKVATDLATNPVAQWASVVLGSMTALAAITAIVGFGMSRLVSGTIAARLAFLTLQAETFRTTVATAGLRAGMTGLTASIFGSTAAVTALRGALLFTGIGAAVLAIGAIAAGIQQIADNARPATEKAKEMFGDLSGLNDALKLDTKEIADGAKEFGELTVQVASSRTVAADWVGELENATGSQVVLTDAMKQTNSAVDEQTFKIGENAAAWVANTLATNKEIQNLFAANSKLAQTGAPTFDQSGLITALTRNDIEGANKLIADFIANAYGANLSKEQLELVNTIGTQGKAAIDAVGGAFEGAATQSTVYNAAMDAAGISTAGLKEDTTDLGIELQTVAQKISAIGESISSAFGQSDLFGTWGDDVRNLAQGLIDTSAGFDALYDGGTANLGNLQSALASTILAGESLGVSATESVAIVFMQLQQMGIDTANLLASIAKIPGINMGQFSSIVGGTTALSGAGQKLAGTYSDITAQAKPANKAIGGTGGASKAAAKEVRTLLDYAGDLNKVFSRAFDIRNGVTLATDDITTGWLNVAEATEEANLAMQEIQATLMQLASTKSINEYFLSVAENYGDLLRAADLRAEIAKNDSDIAKETKNLSKEQNKSSKALDGNSEAAIGNRKTITDMVQSYQDLIVKYAESGADQNQLAIYTAQLKQQFLDQATALGYSSTELQRYAASFDDITFAIQRVPRNITVSADMSPAQQALNEFLARVRNSTASIGGIGGGNSWQEGFNAGRAYMDGWIAASAKRRIVTIADASVPGGKKYTVEGSGQWFFKKGGYTGGVGTNQAAGVVHGQEFVVNAENTAKFRPILEAMNRGQLPIMAGAQNSQARITIVELSPTDRALLAAAGNVQLRIGTEVITGTTNAGNLVSAERGSN